MLPLFEVGYANNTHRRLQQHASHTSSNYIMNLTESICEQEQAIFSNLAIEQIIIYNCFSVEQGALAEIHSDIYNGGGFSHHPVGINNISAWKKNPRRETWNRHAEYAFEHTPLVLNLKWSIDCTKQLQNLELIDKQGKIDKQQARIEKEQGCALGVREEETRE